MGAAAAAGRPPPALRAAAQPRQQQPALTMRSARAAFGVTCVVLATSCAGPTRTHRDYELKAANTAEAVVSAIGTAQAGVQAAREDRATGNFLSVLLRGAADDASAAQETFDSR